MVTYLIDKDTRKHIEVLEQGWMFSEGNLFQVHGEKYIAEEVIFFTQVAGDKASLIQNIFIRRIDEEKED